MFKMEYEQSISAYVCRYCKGSFDHLENLQKHVQQIHTPRSSSKEKICPLCGLRCVKIETYRDHLKHIHRQNEDGNAFVLKCFNDFLVWKNELEKRNYCKYIMQGNPKSLKSSNDKLHIYRCDSSTPTTRERKSACTAKDSCPSMISAIESSKNHSVKVEYWNTHIGHTIPVLGDELNAAIDSLQTTEIVIEDQSYQTIEQDADGNLYFLTESNDGSLSETYVKEVQKKQPPSLFQNDGDSSSSQTLKSAPRKFSFKKDPSKKSVSFSGSLASVACMKASAKKEPVIPTSSVMTTSTSSSKVKTSTPVSASETLELPSEMDNNSTKNSSSVTSTKKSLKKGGKDIVTETVPTSESNATSLLTKNFFPIAPVTSSNQSNIGNVPALPNFSITANDGKLNGQFILLNSLEGQNGQQNLILCPVGANLPSGGQATVVTGIPAQPNLDQNSAKGSQQINKSNVAPPIQNVLTLASNVPCPAGVARTFLPSGPSILKKPAILGKTPTKQKSPPAGTPKAKKRATRKQSLSIGHKLSLLNATSSSTDASNPVAIAKAPSTISPNIKGIITINSPVKGSNPKDSPIAVNQLLPNSLPSGVSYIQINNKLFPINTPTAVGGSSLNSSYILSSPMPSTQIVQPSQSLLNLPTLAQTSTPLVLSNKSNSSASIIGKTSTVKSTLSNDTLPVIVISPSSVSSLSNVLTATSLAKAMASSPVSSRTTKPLQGRSILSNASSKTTVTPSLISNTSQLISAPFQSKLSYTELLNSTQATATKIIVGPASKSSEVNSVVSNTGPISSTPTINIPSQPRAHPQKPGAFIFESSGDLYVLEPIVENAALKTDSSVDKLKATNDSLEKNEISSQSKTNKEISDTECIVLDDNPVENGSNTESIANLNASENASSTFPDKEAKKLKKKKLCPTIANGTQIVSVPQKRQFTEDDAEILKKVKYYDLEMKYLSSQAECKRLKLELAKAHMKNKEDKPLNMEIDPFFGDQDSSTQKSDIEPNITCTLSKDTLINSEEFVINPLTSTMNLDESHKRDQKLNSENCNDYKLEEKFPTNVLEGKEEIVEIPQAQEEIVETPQTQEEIVETPQTQEEIVEIPETQEIDDKEGTCDIEIKDKEEYVNLETVEEKTVNMVEDKLNDKADQSKCDIEDELFLKRIKSNEDSESPLVVENDEPMNYEIVNTGIDTDASVDKLDQVEYHESIETKHEEVDDQSIDIHALDEDSENLEEIVKKQAIAAKDFGRSNNDEGEVEIFENPIEQINGSNTYEKDQVTEETLQQLEIQYGDQPTDIYAMIRTSVLRSLYADMKELCQENKKLFEELQKLKNVESLEVTNEVQVEEL